MSIQNVQTIQRIYDAFGRGALEELLGLVASETRWDFNGGRPAEVPWHAPVGSKAELPRFFGALSEHVDFEAFDPKEFMPSGPHVLVDVRMSYRVKSTGKRVEQQQIQWWTLDDEHRVTGLRHFEDTAQVCDAVRP